MKLIYLTGVFLFLRSVDSLDANSKKFTKEDETKMKEAVVEVEAPKIDEFLDTGISENNPRHSILPDSTRQTSGVDSTTILKKKGFLRYEFIYRNKKDKLICEVEIRTKKKTGKITMKEWKCGKDEGDQIKRRRKWRRKREKRTVW